MWSKEQKEAWEDLENLWSEQPESEKINIQMDHLILELKNKTSEFEKKSIKNDIQFIKENTSDFEKKSIQKDLDFFSKIFSKLFGRKKRE